MGEEGEAVKSIQWIVGLTLIVGCAQKDEAPAAVMEQEEAFDLAADRGGGGFGGAAPGSPAPAEAPRRSRAKMKKASLGSLMVEGKGNMEPEAEPEADDEDGEAAPATRAWFPETFLWEPRVETNASGQASYDVKIPDRLTTWRVLALAHSREGAQAGTVTSFVGTLPVYLDPIVPKQLLVSDVVDVPIQVVNNTEEAVSGKLTAKVEGAVLVAAAGDVKLPRGGSTVRFLRVRADRPGTVKLSARFGRYDAVERTFEVFPRGRLVESEHGGTLASPRTVAIDVASNADPDAVRARLVVYPGALGLLTSEVGACMARGGPADDAYTLLLAGRAGALAEKLGGKVDPEHLRRMRIVATQRTLRHTRAPDPATAALFVEAALAHPEQPVLKRLGDRLASQLQSAQSPDGTFGGGTGWPLQRVLIATADGVRAVLAAGDDEAGERRARAVTVRASGAFERHTRRVEDAYTAAAIVASGGVEGTIRDVLRKRVVDALEQREDGARILPVPKGVVRADGRRPTVVEATALAVLALHGSEDASKLLPDLGAAILSAYRPWGGFGDAVTNLAALRAVAVVFDEPIPENVKIRLTKDGEEVVSGAIDPKRRHERYALSARVRGAVGAHQWKVEAQPPVPGLGFTLTLESYVPWPAPTRRDLALEIDVGATARVGAKVPVAVRVGAPPGTRVTVKHQLPAGVRPDPSSLASQQITGTLERYVVDASGVELTFSVRAGSAPIAYDVIPSFAGTLNAPASSVEILGQGVTMHVPPSVWTVKR
ncbi:MAG: alpha-2-macroglobulin family protein [Deltaproteobacteria bacterium]